MTTAQKHSALTLFIALQVSSAAGLEISRTLKRDLVSDEWK
jgi:hypothetical protein